MSIFSAAAIKVSNLLGLTARGQVTKANSLPVVLASDDDLITATGATSAAAVTTDTTGSINGKLRGLVKWAFERMPASLGQKIMAASFPVVIASDDDLVVQITDAAQNIETVAGFDTDAAVVTDANGTFSGKLRGLVKWAFERMPASLGQKAMSASLPVVLASDQEHLLKAGFTVGIVKGATELGCDGETADWYAVRHASNDLEATDTLDGTANVAKYFYAANAAFNGDPIYVKIPVMVSGWREWMFNFINNLGVSVTVDVYAVGSNAPYSFGSATAYPIASAVDAQQIITSDIVANGGSSQVGMGGKTQTDACTWPVGWLVIKLTPASDPGGVGGMTLMVRRSR